MDSKPVLMLKNFLKGDVSSLDNNFNDIIIEAYRIRNDIYKALAELYRKEKKYNDSEILNIILGLDEVTEKGLLTKEMLDTIKKDPTIIQKYLIELGKK